MSLVQEEKRYTETVYHRMQTHTVQQIVSDIYCSDQSKWMPRAIKTNNAWWFQMLPISVNLEGQATGCRPPMRTEVHFRSSSSRTEVIRIHFLLENWNYWLDISPTFYVGKVSLCKDTRTSNLQFKTLPKCVRLVSDIAYPKEFRWRFSVDPGTN